MSIRNIAARVEYSPGAIYGYFASKDEIFYALAEEGLRDLGARELADAPSADPIEDVRASAWRLYEFSKEQPQYFALVFLDPRVPRVSREYERFAFISEMRSRALARVDRCIAEGLFPPTTYAEVALRLLWAPVVGIAALRLSRRMPDERGSRSAGARRDRDDDCRHPRGRAAACAAGPADAAASAPGAPEPTRPSPRSVPLSLPCSPGAPVPWFDSGLPLCCWPQSSPRRAAARRARHRPTKAADPAAVPVAIAAAVERPITRFIRVTGTLAAEEQADVAAETQGRVVAHAGRARHARRRGRRSDPHCAGRGVGAGRRGRGQRGADREPPRRSARARRFDVDRVPEVANARANLTLAQGDFDRAKMLFDKKLLSQAEFDQRSAQAEVARRQFDIARNGAVQQYQALLGARARVSLARKALEDTVVRAPFAGVVGERLVSVGDYVTRGTKVVSVMRTNPLRMELTVPQQFSVEVGRGPRRVARGRHGARQDLHGSGALRVAGAADRLAHADRGSGRGQRRRIAQARIVCHRADRAGRRARPACSRRRRRCGPCRARRGCSWWPAAVPRSGWSPPVRRSAIWWRSRPG